MEQKRGKIAAFFSIFASLGRVVAQFRRLFKEESPKLKALRCRRVAPHAWYFSSTRQTNIEQEQTKFDDLRRGFTEDFQRLTTYKRTLLKY